MRIFASEPVRVTLAGMNPKTLTRAAFARLAGVNASTVTRAVRPGHPLEPAVEGKRIDAGNPAALAWLREHGVSEDDVAAALISGTTKKAATRAKAKGWTAVNEAKKSGNGETVLQVPEDIEEFLSWSLADLVAQFGTDARFLDWLKATKEIENVNEKRLKNALTKGQLVYRDLVKRGILEPIDAAHRRLLTDGSKTIARRLASMRDAGASVEELEKFVADQVSSFIKPVKNKTAKVLANAG